METYNNSSQNKDYKPLSFLVPGEVVSVRISEKIDASHYRISLLGNEIIAFSDIDLIGSDAWVRVTHTKPKLHLKLFHLCPDNQKAQLFDWAQKNHLRLLPYNLYILQLLQERHLLRQQGDGISLELIMQFCDIKRYYTIIPLTFFLDLLCEADGLDTLCLLKNTYQIHQELELLSINKSLSDSLRLLSLEEVVPELERVKEKLINKGYAIAFFPIKTKDKVYFIPVEATLKENCIESIQAVIFSKSLHNVTVNCNLCPKPNITIKTENVTIANYLQSFFLSLPTPVQSTVRRPDEEAWFFRQPLEDAVDILI